MLVCKEQDGFVLDLMDQNTRWVVTLSNGEKIYQDDDRPEVTPNSAWIRLGEYVRANSLSISDMILQFRSNIRKVNDGPVDGFFFCKSAMGTPGSPKTFQFYVAGTLKNGILVTKRWQIPELELDEVEIRNPEEAGLCLIRNSNELNNQV